MAIKVNGTTVIDDSSNVCANSVCACCVEASSTVTIPSGNTAGRPTGSVGELYFDTDEGKLIAHDGTEWAATGGATLSYTCFYIPTCRTTCYYGQSSCFGCDKENSSLVGANLSPNGSTAVSATTLCIGTCKYGGSETDFLNYRSSIRIDNPADNVYDNEMGGNGFCAFGNGGTHQASIPYCGFTDTDVRATPMFTTGNLDNRNLAVFWCACCNVFRGRCTCACSGGTYCGCMYPQQILFTPTGEWGTFCALTSSCCGVKVVSDYCCGVYASLVGTRNGNCTFGNHVYMLYGFQPCLLYDATSCCATPANSPIQYESFCNTQMTTVGSRVKIDWPNKYVFFFSGMGEYPTSCSSLAKYCICDKGFPDCQACWCLHCVATCFVMHRCMSGAIQGIAQACCGGGEPAVLVGNDCLVTYGCDQCYLMVVGLSTAIPVCSIRFQSHSNGSPYCNFCMNMNTLFQDNDCNLRIITSGVGTTASHIDARCMCAGTYELIYACGSTCFCTDMPCRVFFYRQPSGVCSCVYGYLNICYQNYATHRLLRPELSSNRMSVPITFYSCKPCSGGHISGLLVTDILPMSVATTCYVMPSIASATKGSPILTRWCCNPGCFLCNACCASTSCNQNYWKVCVQSTGGSGTSCTRCIYRKDRCGVALCPGCKTFCCRTQLCCQIDCCQRRDHIRFGIFGHATCPNTV